MILGLLPSSCAALYVYNTHKLTGNMHKLIRLHIMSDTLRATRANEEALCATNLDCLRRATKIHGDILYPMLFSLHVCIAGPAGGGWREVVGVS